MLKMVMKHDGGSVVVVFGLSRGNTERLHKNQPIVINVQDMLGPLCPPISVAIVAGETEAAIAEELQKHFEIPDGAIQITDPDDPDGEPIPNADRNPFGSS